MVDSETIALTTLVSSLSRVVVSAWIYGFSFCFFATNNRKSITLARSNNRLHVVSKRWLIWLIGLRASIR